MNITPIKTEADYEAALAEIDRLMDAAPDTPRGDRLEALVTLVEAYEATHWAIEAPDPTPSRRFIFVWSSVDCPARICSGSSGAPAGVCRRS